MLAQSRERRTNIRSASGQYVYWAYNAYPGKHKTFE